MSIYNIHICKVVTFTSFNDVVVLFLRILGKAAPSSRDTQLYLLRQHGNDILFHD